MDDHLETSRYAIKTLEKALRIYTPSLSEKALADFLADRCDDLDSEIFIKMKLEI